MHGGSRIVPYHLIILRAPMTEIGLVETVIRRLLSLGKTWLRIRGSSLDLDVPIVV